jgi:tetratricopeptide (TPR) repeat protein
MENGKFAEAVAVLDKAVEIPGLTGEQKQSLYFAQVEAIFQQRDLAGMMACLKKGIEAAPEGPKAADMKGIMQRFAPMAEAQETIAKIKPDLDKAEGLERAKLLDQLITAYGKLGMFANAVKGEAPDINGWTKEIIALDADNKAGLKNKYEFSRIVLEGNMLLREKKFEEALSTIDKALALTGISPEQIQEGQMAKGMNYLAQKEYQKCLDCYNKAVEAAPQGPRVGFLKRMVNDVEGQMKKAQEQSKKEEQKPEEKK